MAKRALITGAYGFIGRNVALRFASEGWAVTGLGHGSWTRAEWRQWGIAEWCMADVTLDSLMKYGGKPDVIIHCAGSGSVGFSLGNPYQDFQRTVDTTAGLLEFVRLYAPKAHVVLLSSAGVYGKAQKMPITEQDACTPASPYGMHKLMAEQLCTSYARNFSICVSVVRLFSVYGRGLRKQLLWDACQKIRVGNGHFFGTGLETRDWIHVSDAADLLFLAGKHSDATCPIVNGGSGVGVTVRDVLEELYRALRKDGAPTFSGAAREGDPAHYQADLSHAYAWGWTPKIALRDGMREYAYWFEQEQGEQS